MVAIQKKQFDQTYQTALSEHLGRRSRGAITSRSARRVGKKAVVLGMNASDLARTHDQAMVRLEPIVAPADPKPKKGVPPISPAAIFYIEALEPFEKSLQLEEAKSQRKIVSVERELRQEINLRNRMLDEARHQKEQVRRLTNQFFLAQEAERKEISRDLHDEIAQVLSAINVRLAALKKVDQLNRNDICKRIDQTQKLVEQSVEAVHRYAFRLRPSLLDDLGLVPSLRSFINELSSRNGLTIILKADRDADKLGSDEQLTALYRVAQEALTNIVRHAKAKNVQVSVRKLRDRIRLEIRDDGKGFNAKRILNSTSHTHLGLLGMRERIEMLGGVFSIVSTPSKGTTITADISLILTSNKKADNE